jgi:hypothetical protein
LTSIVVAVTPLKELERLLIDVRNGPMYIYTCVCLHVYVCIHVCIYVCTYICTINVCMYIYIFIYIHTNVYT